MSKVFLEVEGLVFFLKMAVGEEDGPPYDPSVERLGGAERLARMEKSLREVERLAGIDDLKALSEARIARDCAAASLHGLRAEERRKRK